MIATTDMLQAQHQRLPQGRTALQPVFVVGYPGAVGGASTELWHTLKLWRRFGVDVCLIPTGSAESSWRDRCERIGCVTHEVPEGDRDALAAVAGLPGATVVSFCNDRFLATASVYRRLGCKVVWVNCMNWLFAAEQHHYRRQGPFDAYVFQSQYQKRSLLPKLRRFGVQPSQCHHIPGAFDVSEFEFCPRSHHAIDDFYVGRISRADPDKFHHNSWRIWRAVPFSRRRVRVLGWSDAVEQKLGRPPSWAEALPCGSETAQAFFASLHCLMHISGNARENWPRCGLEAMAAGVPVIAQDDFGWPEMIEHGVTGLLADSAAQFAFYAAKLAYEEEYRLQMALAARRRLCEVLACPERIWRRWQGVFQTLG